MTGITRHLVSYWYSDCTGLRIISQAMWSLISARRYLYRQHMGLTAFCVVWTRDTVIDVDTGSGRLLLDRTTKFEDLSHKILISIPMPSLNLISGKTCRIPAESRGCRQIHYRSAFPTTCRPWLEELVLRFAMSYTQILSLGKNKLKRNEGNLWFWRSRLYIFAHLKNWLEKICCNYVLISSWQCLLSAVQLIHCSS